MAEFFQFRGVNRRFIRRDGMFAAPFIVDAVKDVNLTVHKGETLGLVGESGCGKSTLARIAVRLLSPSSGEVLLEGHSLYSSPQDFVDTLPRRMQMVFQDPYSSFNPRLTVGRSVGEALACMGIAAGARRAAVSDMLERVGLEAAHATRYPHEFSGGQRQRLAIARALITRPEMVVCDEPVSSLDAPVQAQVLGLLKDLQDSLALTYLFISHDLAVISHMSDRIAVMHQGRIVELARADDLFARPLHPYTKALLAAVPAAASPGPDSPPPAEAAPGRPEKKPPSVPGQWNYCLYYPFCPEAMEICARSTPEPVPAPAGPSGHTARCFLYAS